MSRPPHEGHPIVSETTVRVMSEPAGTLGVVGAGTMGAGIAQVALEAGWKCRSSIPSPAPSSVAGNGSSRAWTGGARKRGLEGQAATAWVDERLAALTVDGVPRRRGFGRPRHRGRDRGSRREGGDLRQPRCRRRTRHDPCHEHERPVGRRDRGGCRPISRTRRRAPFLQSRAGPAARRGGRRRRRPTRTSPTGRRASWQAGARRRFARPTVRGSSSTG